MKHDFLNKNNLKKLNQELNEYIDQNRYETGKIILEWKGFVHNQYVNPQRNNASSLVSLQTILHECDAIKIDRFSDSFLTIYIKATSTAGQSCFDRKCFLTYKDKNGKIQTCNDFNEDKFSDIFGRQYEMEELEYKKVSGYDNVIPLKLGQDEDSNSSKIEITSRAYSNLQYYIQYDYQKASEIFRKSGFELISQFEYTNEFQFSFEKVKVNKNSITFAHTVRSTYNSLPEMITIKKEPSLKTLSLESLKIEGPGYYHYRSDRLEIRAEDKKEALDFLKEFKTIKRN